MVNVIEAKSLKRHHFLRYTLIPIIPLSIIAYIAISQENFITTSNDHFYFEIISVIISFIIASYAILRGYAFNDKFTLFLGLGFHAAGFIDVLHAIISIISPEQMVSTTNFMAQTWVAGRIVIGVVILIAILKFGTHKIEEKADVITRRTVIFYVVGLSIFAVIITIMSLTIIFPLLNTDLEPNRPYELPSAILFGAAIFYYYRKKLYIINDNFYKGIIVALIIDVFGNLIFTFSTQDFDSSFNVAHILKIVSLIIIILSLASSILQHYKNKEELAIELKKIDKEKDEFSIMITHELRTPLTPIKGWCYALTHPKMLGDLNDKQKKAVITIDRNATRLNTIISNLLDIQKLELNEVGYKYVNTTTKKILEKINNNFEFSMKEKNIRFTTTYDDVNFQTDETKIIQVLSNLIQNSVDFTPIVNAKIEVDVKKEGDDIIFCVKDNGIGISEENQINLFKKFYQIDTSITRKHGGTGLGLTICKGFVEGLDGKIWVKSSDGKGSTFYFTIPIKNNENTSS